MTGAAATITAPGVYEIPGDEYHRDPVVGGSLSSTGARKLLPPSCPAKFRWWREHGEPDKPAWDMGHAAHRKVLGAGPELVVIDAPDWRSPKTRKKAAEARIEGKVPILASQNEVVEEMAAAIRAHPLAGALFAPDRGRPEQTVVWRDPETGVWCRALVDFLHHWPNQRGIFILPEYKSAASAAPEDLPSVMQRWGYHLQLDWHIDCVRHSGAVAKDTPIAGLLVVQEKDPPYLVTIAQPDPTALGVARTRNRYARARYARCMDADDWPGYSGGVVSVSLPPWVEWQHKDAVARGDFHFDTESFEEIA